MPPKKREKESEPSKNQRVDTLKTDHDMFLQAFEKPTQIYRYLRERNTVSPIFLYRNLSYMRYRMSRSHKTREGFKVDSLLERVKSKNHLVPEPFRKGFMTLTFLGFYDKKGEGGKAGDSPKEPVKVETLLLKICHKKRKDTAPFMTVTVGTCYVPINPSEEHPPPKAPTVSISADEFDEEHNEIQSYHLLLRVYHIINNGLSGSNNTDQETGEPLQKRRKTSMSREEVKLHGTDLVIYDKHRRCVLGDGDYELLLDEMKTSKKLPKRYPSWEQIGDISEDQNAFDLFSHGPTLKFKLEWSQEQRNSFVDRPRVTPINEDEVLDSNSNKENRPERRKQATEKKDKEERKSSAPDVTTPPIVYQFHYNNNSRQQTEPCCDLHCPWCSIDCGTLYGLLKHLKLCHARFTFTYIPMGDHARIDVSINELYDGSYTGSPYDVIAQPGRRAFSRGGPQIRTSVSNIVVCHPKRPKPSLTEFMELEEESGDLQRSFITGHNRLYHHTVTCLPVHPKEMDNDSEGENDPKWLQTKTMMMIDEFTDVNEGEKELMKMWNLHVMKEGYVGDCQIPLACMMFLEKKGKELLEKNLYRNFVVHMCSLFDFGLVSPIVFYQTIQMLHNIIEETHGKALQKSWEAQKAQWIKSERQNTPSHFKSQSGPSAHSDPNVRRKLYSPGAYQPTDSPNRRKNQQQKNDEEDEDEDGEDGEDADNHKKTQMDDGKVLKKEDGREEMKSGMMLSLTESGAPRRKSLSLGSDAIKSGNNGLTGENIKRKSSLEKSGSVLSSASAAPKSSIGIKTPNGPPKPGPSSLGLDALKKKVPVSSQGKSSVASPTAQIAHEPPNKKKLVTHANGKLQVVTAQMTSTNADLKRKTSFGVSGSDHNAANSPDAKKKVINQRPISQTNGIPLQFTGKNQNMQLVGDSKKRASLPSVSGNQSKSSSPNVTNPNSAVTINSDIKKKPTVNGVMTPTDQGNVQKKKLPQPIPAQQVAHADSKLLTNCTVELVHYRRDSKDSNSSSSSGMSSTAGSSSDMKCKSSPGQNQNGTASNQQENGPQRRKSLSSESPNTLESGLGSLRRKSFSSNQSIESSAVSVMSSKGLASL